MAVFQAGTKISWTHIRNTATVWGALCLCGLMVAPVHAEESPCSAAQEALKEASRIRGLPSKGEVPCFVRSRDDVEQFLRELIRKKYPPHKLAMEELVFRAVGLIPDDYEYQNGIIEAYVGQIGGYYDPDKKHFVVVQSIPRSLQRVVAIHELTHALQDQYYDLNRFLDPKIEDGDESLAHAAVTEGDANLVMQEALRADRQSGKVMPNFLEDSGNQEDQPPLPEALQEMLLFPYEEGLRFVRAVQKKGGLKAREKLFQKPPRSTREIVHPDEFMKGTAPFDIPTDAEVLDGRDVRKGLYSDTLGEFGIATILGTENLGPRTASEAARGWRGDRAVVIRAKEGVSEVIWLSQWDTVQDAKQFLTAYRALLQKKYPGSGDAMSMQLSQSKSVSMEMQGRSVLIAVSLRE
jgi:hypothetical protein